MLCVRALVRALNDSINYVQQGCAMQFDGITLSDMERCLRFKYTRQTTQNRKTLDHASGSKQLNEMIQQIQVLLILCK